MTDADPIGAALAATRALERLWIPYAVVGSVASTLHGEPRATADVDLVARIEANQVDVLEAALQEAFFVQPGAIREALRLRMPLDLIHRATYSKVDVFPRPDEGITARTCEPRSGCS